MKKGLRKNFIYGLVLATTLLSVFPASVARAAGETVLLTPASGTAHPGDTFVISVDGYVGSTWWGGGATGVNGTLNFPADILTVTDIDDSSTTFSGSSTVTPDNSNGKITFDQSSGWFQSAKNQDVHLFTITFKSLKDGNAAVSFGSTTYVGIGAAATSGGLYTINTPTPPPTTKPKPKPKPKPTVKPTPTPTQKPKPVDTPKKPSTTNVPKTPSKEEVEEPTQESNGGIRIEQVKVVATRQENTIAWTVNDPDANSTLLYGKSKADLKDKPVVTQLDDKNYFTELKNLDSGTLYYFTIVAKTKDNLKETTYNGTLTTRGYPVQLIIKLNNLLVPGAQIKIGERSFVADNNAFVLTELADGEQTATITPPNSSESYTVAFAVAKKNIPTSGNPDLQSFILDVQARGSSSGLNGSILLPLLAGGTAIAVVAGGIIGFILLKRRQAQFAKDTAGVDSDLLVSSYGAAIDQRLNTPEPQLGSVMETQLSNAEVQNGITDTPSEITASVQNQNVSTNDSPKNPAPLPTLPPSESTIAPSPPQTEILQVSKEAPEYNEQLSEIPSPSTSDNNASVETVEQMVTAEPDEETLSPELSRIESSEETTAVYHEDNGELDIIHHSPKSNLPTANTQTTVMASQ